MRGLVDRLARDCAAGDTIVEPISGVLCRVLEMGSLLPSGMVTIRLQGLSSLSEFWASWRGDKPLRAYPRTSGRGAEDRDR